MTIWCPSFYIGNWMILKCASCISAKIRIWPDCLKRFRAECFSFQVVFWSHHQNNLPWLQDSETSWESNEAWFVIKLKVLTIENSTDRILCFSLMWIKIYFLVTLERNFQHYDHVCQLSGHRILCRAVYSRQSIDCQHYIAGARNVKTPDSLYKDIWFWDKS